MNNKDYWDYKNILELLNIYGFELIVNDDFTLSLKDLEGANLGDIESDTFKDFDDVIDRLEIYHYDYIVRDLEEQFDIKEENFDNWKEIYRYLKKENKNSYDTDILGLIVGGI